MAGASSFISQQSLQHNFITFRGLTNKKFHILDEKIDKYMSSITSMLREEPFGNGCNFTYPFGQGDDEKMEKTRRRGHGFDYEEKGRNEKHGAELKYVKLAFPTFLKRMVTSL